MAASVSKRASSARAVSIQEKAYLFLRNKILSGDLAPGEPLSEASIARQLGSSRGPLREAVRRLTAEGFLCQTPQRGSIVVEFTRRDIAELYELREALEVYAVRHAAEHTLAPNEDEVFDRLVSEILVLRDELVASGESCLSPEGMQRFLQNDLRFHMLLVRAAANRRILKTFADTRVLLNIFALRRTRHDVAQLAEIHRYHHDILTAVQGHEPVEAARLLGEHIRVSREERLREYDQREREAAMLEPMAGFDLAGVL